MADFLEAADLREAGIGAFVRPRDLASLEASHRGLQGMMSRGVAEFSGRGGTQGVLQEQGKVMSKIGKSPVRIRNYWLEKHIEEENATGEDGTELIWQYDHRMRIVEPLIRDTAYFGSDVAKLSKNHSLVGEGDTVLKCIEGSNDIAQAKLWIFSHLYQHAIHQANAIYVLFSTSHISQGFQLWRSLFETHVMCEFLHSHLSNSELIQDYISHTLLRSWIRMKKGINELFESDGLEMKYHESQIARCKDSYKSKGWKLNEDYAWAKLVLKEEPCRFHHILRHVASDMALLYRISSMEIHPTPGKRFAILGKCLPLPAVPMFLFGVVNREELHIDFLTAKTIHRITCRADEFIAFDDGMRDRFESLKAKGTDVLEERKYAIRPAIQGDGG